MQKKIPQRQCMGCRERKAKRELIRVGRSPEGEVSLDFGGKKNGRGAYICPDPECLKKAIRSKGPCKLRRRMGVAAKCQLRASRVGKIFRRSSQLSRSPAKTMTAAQIARAASAHQPSSKKGPISNPRSRTVKIMAKSSLYQKL